MRGICQSSQIRNAGNFDICILDHRKSDAVVQGGSYSPRREGQLLSLEKAKSICRSVCPRLRQATLVQEVSDLPQSAKACSNVLSCEIRWSSRGLQNLNVTSITLRMMLTCDTQKASTREVPTVLLRVPQTIPTHESISSQKENIVLSSSETSVPNKVTIVPSKFVSKLYPCPIPQCKKGYVREDRLRSHIRSSLDSLHQTYWTDLNNTVCGQCKKVLRDPAGLKKHESSSHGRHLDMNQKGRTKGISKMVRNARSRMPSDRAVFVAAKPARDDQFSKSPTAVPVRERHRQPSNSKAEDSVSKELESPTAGDEQIPATDQPQLMTENRLAATSLLPHEQQQWVAVGNELPWEEGHWFVRDPLYIAADPVPGEEQWSEMERSLTWDTSYWHLPANSGALAWETIHWDVANTTSLATDLTPWS